MKQHLCPICGELPAHTERRDNYLTWRKCHRCGDYLLHESLREAVKDQRDKNPDLWPYLSAHTKQASAAGQPVTLTLESWQDDAQGHSHTSPTRMIDMLLRVLEKRTKFFGAMAPIDPQLDYPLIDARDPREAVFCLQHLVQAGYIGEENVNANVFTLRVKAWEQLMPGPGGKPGLCFVAMASNQSLDEAYENGFKKAITDCGLYAYLVERVNDNDNITDTIIGGIRQARVVVVDCTYHKPNVYYEAGFADGLGRTVVWTCRKDNSDKLPFDTRSYRHIIWDDVPALRSKLKARLLATVPEARESVP